MPVRDGASKLFQRIVNRREDPAEIGAQPVHSSNDRQRNAGRDQAIFDRRRAGIVRQEPQKQMFQRCLRIGCAGYPADMPYLYGRRPKAR